MRIYNNAYIHIIQYAIFNAKSVFSDKITSIKKYVLAKNVYLQ